MYSAKEGGRGRSTSRSRTTTPRAASLAGELRRRWRAASSCCTTSPRPTSSAAASASRPSCAGNQPSAPRPPRPRGVRADRRADRPHRPPHPLRWLRPCASAAPGRSRATSCPSRSTCRRARSSTRRWRSTSRGCWPSTTSSPRCSSLEAAWKMQDHARPGARHRDARAPVGDRPALPDRRLRHRLLLAGQPQAPARRHDQDRQVVRARDGDGALRRGDRALDDRARPQPRPPGHRRGSRGPPDLGGARAPRLRLRPGLLPGCGRCRPTSSPRSSAWRRGTRATPSARRCSSSPASERTGFRRAGSTRADTGWPRGRRTPSVRICSP